MHRILRTGQPSADPKNKREKSPGMARGPGEGKIYPETLKFYSEQYGLPYQTVKNARKRRWPLNEPLELLKKFLAAPGKKPPLERLIAITGYKESESRVNLDAPSGVPEGGVDSEEDFTDVDEDLDVSEFRVGLIAELKRLQRETAKSYRAYREEDRPADKMVRQKIYLANVAALRMLAKEAPKAEREAGNTLVVSDVDSAWSRAAKEFKSSAEAMGRRIATNSMFAGLDPVDVEELVDKEVATMLSYLEIAPWIDQKEES